MVPSQTTVAAMGEAIWKFELHPWSNAIDMPQGAKILSVGVQGSAIVMWALCDIEATMAPRLVSATPTGVSLPRAYHGATFVGTAQMADGLVFHVWDGGERSA
jgi:hypothetical protein